MKMQILRKMLQLDLKKNWIILLFLEWETELDTNLGENMLKCSGAQFQASKQSDQAKKFQFKIVKIYWKFQRVADIVAQNAEIVQLWVDECLAKSVSNTNHCITNNYNRQISI